MGNNINKLKQLYTVNDKETPVIYHYTTLEALINGLISLKGICLRATNCEYLNDISEIKEGLSQISEKIIFERLYPWFSKTCSISFSRVSDSLPMWNTYGNKGMGIALGFDTTIILETINELKNIPIATFPQISPNPLEYSLEARTYFPQLVKCIYNYKSRLLHDFFDKSIEIANAVYKGDINEDASVFISTILSIKNLCFEYEQEIRLIGCGLLPDVPNQFMAQPTTSFKYRCNNNMLIPYKEYIFPRNSLKELWIGPTQNKELSQKSIELFLHENNINSCQIRLSNLPYRNK